MVRRRRSGASGHGTAAVLAVAVGAVVAFRAGDAPASVAEQRARLPPPATCEDPIEGIWRSHLYNERRGQWTIWTLTIRRKAGSAEGVVGSISNQSWHADPDRSEPGNCTQNPWHYKVTMDAEGTYRDGQVAFGGTKYEIQPWPCAPISPFIYYLDNFTGTVDPKIQEFQSVNNDGGSAVNEPAVFRRIRCFDQADDTPEPKPVVEPPPFFPPRNAGC